MKQNSWKRFVAAAAAFALTLSCAQFAGAVNYTGGSQSETASGMPAAVSVYATQSCKQNFSTAYKSKLKGDQAYDIVEVAKAQIGKTKKELGYTENWCADFVSDCARLAGISKSVIPHTGGVSDMYSKMKDSGAKKVSTAKKGDLVFYKRNGKFCHVAIMQDSKKSIHGNLFYPSVSNVYRMDYTEYYYEKKGDCETLFLRPAYSDSSSGSSGNENGGSNSSTSGENGSSNSSGSEQNGSDAKEKTYTVKYNANGGSGSMAATKVTYGVSTNLTANAFTKSGYKFAGWFAQRKSDSKWYYSDAKGENGKWYKEGSQPSGYYKHQYKDQCTVSKTTSTDGDIVTLYAQWVKFGVDSSKLEVKKSQAHVYTSFTKPAGIRITKASIYVWPEGQSRPSAATYTESYSQHSNYVSSKSLPINYVIGKGKEVDYTLKSGTTYKYVITCQTSNITLSTGEGTFTTTGTKPAENEGTGSSGTSGGSGASGTESGNSEGSGASGAENGNSGGSGTSGTIGEESGNSGNSGTSGSNSGTSGTENGDSGISGNAGSQGSSASGNVSHRIILTINDPFFYLDGVKKNIDDSGTKPLIRNNRTLTPLRAVIEAMGGSVGWDGSTRTVSCTLGGRTLYLTVGSATARDSAGTTYKLDAAPQIINNRTMLPIRFAVEYFNGSVDWDGTAKKIIINYSA